MELDDALWHYRPRFPPRRRLDLWKLCARSPENVYHMRTTSFFKISAFGVWMSRNDSAGVVSISRIKHGNDRRKLHSRGQLRETIMNALRLHFAWVMPHAFASYAICFVFLTVFSLSLSSRTVSLPSIFTFNLHRTVIFRFSRSLRPCPMSYKLLNGMPLQLVSFVGFIIMQRPRTYLFRHAAAQNHFRVAAVVYKYFGACFKQMI